MKIININTSFLEDFPPLPYIEQVALNIHEALTTYIRLWRLKDNSHKIILKRKDITRTFLRSIVKFEVDLMKLCAQGLLSFTYQKRIYVIELTGWNNDESGES
jgi:hypothetical protein